MTAETPPTASASRSLTARTAITVAAGGAVLLLISIVIARLTPFSETFVVGALVPYLLFGVIAISRIRVFHPYARFGLANGLTLTRLVLTSLFGGVALSLMLSDMALAGWSSWFFCSVAILTLILDGFDGYAARREGFISRFGGRFDMEVDALQIMLLSVTALVVEKAGPWVLISGALRYAYELAGMVWPVLTHPLPPSWRRKVVSVIQGSVLAALLAPIIMPPFSVVIAAVALALLIYSFAVDVIWLARSAPRAPAAAV